MEADRQLPRGPVNGALAEELYARFPVLDTAGSWGGTDPLALLIAKKDAA